MKTIECPVCRSIFTTSDNSRKTCSWECRNSRISSLYKGREFTEEHKKSISANHHDVRGRKNPNWNGGKHYRNGYCVLFCPDHPYASKQGYVAEHRLVMEKHLGRYLGPQEVVHHINGNKGDNRLENLQLFDSLKEHSSFHQQLRKTNNNDA